jgi:hypothetical protein
LERLLLVVHRYLLLLHHLEDIWNATRDGTNWIIMRSSGDVSSITATTLGLGNVANTSPSDLPISNAVSSVMSFKANLTGANFFSGNYYSSNNTRYDINISRWNEFK